MSSQDQISIDIFKVIARAMSQSSNLDIMANHMVQLLVAALDIKACTIFALNPETDELEILASVGLSLEYLDKGPIMADKSIVGTLKGESIVIRDVAGSDRLQYPEEAAREGIGAMVSVPILFSGTAIGVLRLYHREVWDISPAYFFGKFGSCHDVHAGPQCAADHQRDHERPFHRRRTAL